MDPRMTELHLETSPLSSSFALQLRALQRQYKRAYQCQDQQVHYCVPNVTSLGSATCAERAHLARTAGRCVSGRTLTPASEKQGVDDHCSFKWSSTPCFHLLADPFSHQLVTKRRPRCDEFGCGSGGQPLSRRRLGRSGSSVQSTRANLVRSLEASGMRSHLLNSSLLGLMLERSWDIFKSLHSLGVGKRPSAALPGPARGSAQPPRTPTDGCCVRARGVRAQRK